MNVSGCGITNEHGRDCRKPTVHGSPLNLCAKHMSQAAEWYASVKFNAPGPFLRLMRRCPQCDRKTLVSNVIAMTVDCRVCGYEEKTVPSPRLPDPDPNVVDSDESVVYYIRFGGRVKIGYTANLAGRLADLPHDELLATERGGRELEKARHRQFSHLRVTGEWFRHEEDLHQFIGTLPVLVHG